MCTSPDSQAAGRLGRQAGWRAPSRQAPGWSVECAGWQRKPPSRTHGQPSSQTFSQSHIYQHNYIKLP